MRAITSVGPAAAAQGELHQAFHALLRVGVLAHGVGDGVRADHAGQAVRADQVAVTGEHLADAVLRVDVAAVQRPGEQ